MINLYLKLTFCGHDQKSPLFLFFLLALKSIEIDLKKRWSYLRLLEHSFEPPASKSETPASFHLNQ